MSFKEWQHFNVYWKKGAKIAVITIGTSDHCPEKTIVVISHRASSKSQGTAELFSTSSPCPCPREFSLDVCKHEIFSSSPLLCRHRMTCQNMDRCRSIRVNPPPEDLFSNDTSSHIATNRRNIFDHLKSCGMWSSLPDNIHMICTDLSQVDELVAGSHHTYALRKLSLWKYMCKDNLGLSVERSIPITSRRIIKMW